MKVGDLKRYLSDFDDNTEVVVKIGDKVRPLEYITDHCGKLALTHGIWGDNWGRSYTKVFYEWLAEAIINLKYKSKGGEQ